MLMVAGCASSRPRQAANAVTVVTEPGDGLAPLYHLMESATATLDMTMYELVDPQAETILAADAARGVTVRVILDHHLEGVANGPAFGFLAARGVAVRWAPPGFAATHEKAFVVDARTAAIMTLNLTSRYYAKTRDFAIVDSDPTDVAAIEGVLSADFAAAATTPGAGDDLLWSPGSGSRLEGLISSARTSVAVENEELSARNRGRPGRRRPARRGRDPHHDCIAVVDRRVQPVERRRRPCTDLPRRDPIYIHAKTVVVDAGTATAAAFVGSENFTLASLDRNRELGLIVTAPAVGSSLQSTLASDLAGATPWQADG